MAAGELSTQLSAEAPPGIQTDGRRQGLMSHVACPVSQVSDNGASCQTTGVPRRGTRSRVLRARSARAAGTRHVLEVRLVRTAASSGVLGGTRNDTQLQIVSASSREVANNLGAALGHADSPGRYRPRATSEQQRLPRRRRFSAETTAGGPSAGAIHGGWLCVGL